jgi:hypothetical protein
MVGLWRPYNITPLHSLTGPVGQPFASRLGGQQFASPGWNWVSPVSAVSLQVAIYSGFYILKVLYDKN